LVELLLTTVLMMLLVGAVVFSFSTLQSHAQLEEGAQQLESLIRFVRAQAAHTGCRVQITFDEAVSEDLRVPLGNLFVSWEPNPLGQPGRFEPLFGAANLVESIAELVQVEDVAALGFAAANPLTPRPEGAVASEEVEASFAPIVFYPDGSSDSAEIILASRAEEDTRRIAVRILGMTGAVRREFLGTEGSPAEVETNHVAVKTGAANEN
jgi:hypothetical protein